MSRILFTPLTRLRFRRRDLSAGFINRLITNGLPAVRRKSKHGSLSAVSEIFAAQSAESQAIRWFLTIAPADGLRFLSSRLPKRTLNLTWTASFATHVNAKRPTKN